MSMTSSCPEPCTSRSCAHRTRMRSSPELTCRPQRPPAGVRLALAGADLSGKIGNVKPNWVIPGTVVPDRPVLAVDRVRFVGECVALVVAETREAAHDALELIGVAYKVLPAVVDGEAAI